MQIWIAITKEGRPPGEPPPHVWRRPSVKALDHAAAGVRVVAHLSPAASAAACCGTRGHLWLLRLGGAFRAASVQDERADNDPRIQLDLRSAALSVQVPFTATMQLFHARAADGIRISNDPRILHDRAMELDPAGLYALLQFGALMAPFTLWREIRRFMPGCETTISGGDLTPREGGRNAGDSPTPPQSVPPREQEESVAGAIDHALRLCCPDGRPVILFSGGVDSSLLAARAAALGWNETLLAHYRRDPDDPETLVARSVARQLALPLREIELDAGGWADAMARLAQAYPQPLGDYSLVPTLRLVEEALRLGAGRQSFLDGTGADGTFGSFVKLARWRRLYRLPAWARWMGATAFRAGSLWSLDRPLARRLGAARTSLRLPYLLGSMIAENPLEGIAYRFPRAIRESVQRSILDALALRFPWSGEEMPSRGLDLRHVVCDLTAQKDAPLFLGRTEEIRYPFLDPPLVELGLRLSLSPRPGAPSKDVLKRLLVRQVSPDLIYRSKSGFNPPIGSIFAAPAVGRILEEQLIEGATALRPYLEMPVVASMASRARRGTPLPHASYNFLWTALCVSLWLSQFDALEARAKARGAEGDGAA
ncbi:MAG: asparagine synthase C-terminal domain-containing protein [Candidatus Eisenbacteria bacterium]